MKTTAIAPSNIAFIKYWGRTDEKLRLPTNGSISMNLSNLLTTTTVEFRKDLKRDEITIDDVSLMIDDLRYARISNHLDRIRKLAKTDLKARVVSINNFPASTGLSSSASGFAALTLAGTKAAGLDLDKKELSILARQGSGSACRSIPDGFVQWLTGETSEESYAKSIFPADYWDILDIVVILSEKKKKISTSVGQQHIFASPLFRKRLQSIDKKLAACKKYLAEKDFKNLGKLIEEEAEQLHRLMKSSHASLDYLFPETKQLITKVKSWRMSGIPVYLTLNTGHNVHLIVERRNKDAVLDRLKTVSFIKTVIVNKPAPGARLSKKHLF